VIERLAEAGDPLVEQPLGHVVERNAAALDRGDCRTRLVDVSVEARRVLG
jgi:hypothetical protein